MITQPNSFERYQNYHLQKATAATDTSNISSEHTASGFNATQLVWPIIFIGLGAGAVYICCIQARRFYKFRYKDEN